MRNRTKTIIVTLLTIVSLLTCFGANSVVKVVAVGSEMDGNDTFANATTLSSNESVTGQISGSNDADWYKLKIKKAVAFQFKFSNLDKEKASWKISIYNSNLKLITSFSTELSDYITYTSPLGYEKGSEVYYVVEPQIYSVGKSYQIEVIYLTNYDWEKECNDDSSSATKLVSTKPLCGVLNEGNIYDYDWYVYTVKSEDPFYFELSNLNKVGGSWTITIYGNDLKQLTDFYTDGKSYITDTKEYQGFKKGDKVYIRIERGLDFLGYSTGKIYELKVIDNFMELPSNDKKSDSDADSSTSDITVYSALSGTNVVVGKADGGAKVSVKYGKKTYTVTADSNGIFKVKTAKLKKGNSIIIWQTVDEDNSEKATVKVTNK